MNSPEAEEVAPTSEVEEVAPTSEVEEVAPTSEVEEVAQRPSRDRSLPGTPVGRRVAAEERGTPVGRRVAAEERGGVSRRLVTVAHGTRTAVGNEVAVEITAAAGRRLGVEATASYVELCEPLFADVVATPFAGTTAVVPLLLSTGFHVTHDLPDAIAAAGAEDRVALGGPFGPDPLLARAQVDRLMEAGAEPGRPVVMVAAGSTDPAAMTDLEGAVALLADAWGCPARLATLSGLGPRPAEVVQPGDVVSPYLLSTGFFDRRLREEVLAAGAVVVADVIGPHPAVVDLLVERARYLLA